MSASRQFWPATLVRLNLNKCVHFQNLLLVQVRFGAPPKMFFPDKTHKIPATCKTLFTFGFPN